MSLAIVPGSFDPMTLGHLDIVRVAAKRYDRVVVAVMINRAKRYCFDMDTRVRLAEATVAEFRNVRVIAETGMLIDLFDRLGADAVCKGWRNQKDFDYELHMADWNRAHNPSFRTELIYAKNQHLHLSSTLVRERLRTDTEWEELLHPDAVAIIREMIENRRNQ